MRLIFCLALSFAAVFPVWEVHADPYVDAMLKKARCPDRACMLRVDAEMKASQIAAQKKKQLSDAYAFCDYKGATSGPDAKSACTEYVRRTGKSPGS